MANPAMDLFLFGGEEFGFCEGVSMKKITLTEKITRLKRRLGEREWRRYGTLLIVGKAAGLAVILLLALLEDRLLSC